MLSSQHAYGISLQGVGYTLASRGRLGKWQRAAASRSPLSGLPQYRGPLTQAIPFELADDATAPGTPVAYRAYQLDLPYAGRLRKWNVTTGSTGADPDYLIHVLDMQGNKRALGYDTLHPHSLNGARGWAVKCAPGYVLWSR